MSSNKKELYFHMLQGVIYILPWLNKAQDRRFMIYYLATSRKKRSLFSVVRSLYLGSMHRREEFYSACITSLLFLLFITRRIITGWTGSYAATSQGYTLVMLELFLRLVACHFMSFSLPFFLCQYFKLFKISMKCCFHHLVISVKFSMQQLSFFKISMKCGNGM